MNQQQPKTSRKWLIQHTADIDWISRLQSKAKGKVNMIERLELQGTSYVCIRMCQPHRQRSIRRIAGSDTAIVIKMYSVDDPQAILMRQPENARNVQVHHFEGWRKRARSCPHVESSDVQCGQGKRWIFTYCTPHSPISCEKEMPLAIQDLVNSIRCTAQPPMYYMYVEFSSNIKSSDLLNHMCTIQGLRPKAISFYKLLEKVSDASKCQHPAMRIILEHQAQRNELFREWTRPGVDGITTATQPECFESLREALLLSVRLKQFTSSKDTLLACGTISQRINAIRQATTALHKCRGLSDVAEVRRILGNAYLAISLHRFGAYQAVPDEAFVPVESRAHHRVCHWIMAYDWSSGPVQPSVFGVGERRVVHMWNTISTDSSGNKVRYAYLKFHKRVYDGNIRECLADYGIKYIVPATGSESQCIRTLLCHQMIAHDHFEGWHEDGRSGAMLPSFLAVHAPADRLRLTEDRLGVVKEMPRIKARLDSVNARLLRPLDDVDTEQSYRKELWKNIFRTEALLHDAETP